MAELTFLPPARSSLEPYNGYISKKYLFCLVLKMHVCMWAYVKGRRRNNHSPEILSHHSLVIAVYSFLNSLGTYPHLWEIPGFFSVFSLPALFKPATLRHIALQNQCLICTWIWRLYFCIPLWILGEWPKDSLQETDFAVTTSSFPHLPFFFPAKMFSQHWLYVCVCVCVCVQSCPTLLQSREL